MTSDDARARPEAEPARTHRRPSVRRQHIVAALVAAGIAGLILVAFVRALAQGESADDATRVGAEPVGSAQYPVPKDAIFVSPQGSDDQAGTKSHPVRSVQLAVTLARSGQTIVLREGTYRQRVTITPDKRVTVQPFTGEKVWFDGSKVVDAWEPEGSVWISNGWTTQLDASPTYTRGAPDNTEPGWIFLNPEYALAAHPDQLFVDGDQLKQVASRAEVVAGTFAVDYGLSQLIIGTDPDGHVIRASDKSKAFSVQSEGSVLKGFGVRRYATSVPGFGAVTVEAPNVTIEDLAIEDNATTGLFIAAADATVKRVSTLRNGMLGFGANYADRLTVQGLKTSGNNTEHFNNAPVSGGAKLTRSRDVTIRGSLFDRNHGPGLWFDQSNYKVDVIGNTVSANQGHGLILEISSHFVVAGNTIADNRDNGVKVNDTDHVEVWNNTVTGNGRDISIVQDDRRATNIAIPGHDPRRPVPDPEMPWVIGKISVSNNVFSGAADDALLAVEDYSGEFTAAQMGVTINGNIYHRSGETPAWLIVWASPGRPATYTTLTAFQKATGQETDGIEIVGDTTEPSPWLTDGVLTTEARSATLPIPAHIASLLNWGSVAPTIGAR